MTHYVGALVVVKFPSYERLVAPHFSIGTEVNLCFGSVAKKDASYFYLGMSAAAAD
jgi:hypothetical protein